MMSFTGVLKLLDQQIGLHGEAVSDKALNRAVRNRMAHLKITDETAYLDRLLADRQEMEWLIDRTVVCETWFFRDIEPFVYLRKYMRDFWRSSGRSSFRILSIPCSSGEEPYSIAMTLRDMENPPPITIDAVDVSHSALKKARKGRYGRNSFRENDMGPYWRYFHQRERDWLVKDDILGMVNFHHGNILDYDTLAHNAPYHAVFCRNLLIYLGEEARGRAVDHINRLLCEDGVLFLGYAESRQQFFPGFFPVEHRRAYAALKPGPQSTPSVTKGTRPAGPPGRKKSRPLKKASPEGKPRSRPEVVSNKELPGPPLKDDLERARYLADSGRLSEATRICESVLDQNPGRAEAHFLMGVIALAKSRDSEAEQCFARALYLDPEHQPSLTYMALLMEKLCRPEKAGLFRGRLARVQDRRPTGDERNSVVS